MVNSVVTALGPDDRKGMKYKINYDFDCSKSQAILEVDNRVTEFESWDVMFLVRGSGKPGGGEGTRPFLGISESLRPFKTLTLFRKKNSKLHTHPQFYDHV